MNLSCDKELPCEIFIETVLACNLRCKHCPVPNMSSFGRKPSIMSMTTWHKILEQISDKPRIIRLNMMGEPLLHPNIADIAEQASYRGHSIHMTTNGVLMTNNLALRLSKVLSHVTFSMDGMGKTYEKLRPNAVWNDVVKNIVAFHEHSLTTKCQVQVDCIASALTTNEVQIRKFWETMGIPLRMIPLDDYAGQWIPPAYMGTPLTSTEGPYKTRHPCRLLWKVLHIGVEGRPLLCCHDFPGHVTIETIHDHSLLYLWENSLRSSRARHLAGDYDFLPCKGCHAWRRMAPLQEAQS